MCALEDAERRNSIMSISYAGAGSGCRSIRRRCKRFVFLVCLFFLCFYGTPGYADWWACCTNGCVANSFPDQGECFFEGSEFFCPTFCDSALRTCIFAPTFAVAQSECEALNVNLTDFLAQPAGGSILITWKTASEVDNAGFHLWRSDAEDGEYSRITAALIPAEGGPTWGAEYEHRDTDVRPGRTYYYKLEDIDDQGLSTFHGPVSATVESLAVPTLSQWGAIVFSLILGTGAVLALRRRRMGIAE
jgi:hypothetical protein